MSDVDVGAPAPASETPVADTPAVDTTATPATETTDTRARGENGQFRTPTMDDTLAAIAKKAFAPKDPDQPEAPETATGEPEPGKEAGEETTVQTPETEKAKAAAPETDPPLSWTGDMKAKWASLPPEFRDLQEYAAKRDREQNDAINRAGQQIKAFVPLGNVIEQYADVFQRNKVHPVDAIGQLLGAERQLAQNSEQAVGFIAKRYISDPRVAIASVAKAFGLDPRGLSWKPPEGQEQAVDPRVSNALAQTRRELAEARGTLAQVTSHLTAQQKAEVQAQEAALARQIADFAKDKPHFEEVRRHMGALMSVDASLSIDDAYDRAIYAVPDIRNRILTDQRKAEEDKRAKEAQAKAVDARKSAQVNVKSSGSVGASPKSMDDTLSEIARRRYA
jgi:hypothetical protein